MIRPPALARMAVLAGLAGLAGQAPVAGAPQAGWQVGILTPRYLTVGGHSTPLTAQVLDATGQPAPDGTQVAFLASLGLTVDPSTALTRDGLASTRLSSGTEAGFARLDATVDGVRADSLLWIRPGPAAHLLRLESEPSEVAPGGRVRIHGELRDSYGNLAEGDAVRWSVEGGSLFEASEFVAHGEVQAVYVAGPAATRGGVRLEAATASGRVAILVARPGPAQPPSPLWLPLALTNPAQVVGCTDLVTNGGFEADLDGDGLADGWTVAPEADSQPRRIADAAEGMWAVRLVGVEHATPAGLRQALAAPPGARNGELWLWARGAPVGGGLRLAVWSTITLGDETTRAPLLVRQLSLPEASWERLAFRLPIPPSGSTTLEIEPWSEDASPPLVEVDGLALRACW